MIPSAQRLVWAAKQPLGKAALSPDTPGSLEGNTEGPGTASSERESKFVISFKNAVVQFE